MKHKIIKPSADATRREFLQNLLAGSASATVLMVYNLGGADSAEAQEARKADGKTNYTYVMDLKNCIGCGNCVRACSRENNVPAGYFRTWVERYVETDEGVYVDSPDGGMQGFEAVNESIRAKAKAAYTVPKMCNHCKNAPCVQVCPVGATFRTDDGFVLIDEKHCIGCGYCVQACPYGARFINPVKRKADKCTWCYHRVKNGKMPACVTVCPTRTRLFGDLNDPDSAVSKILGKREYMVLKPHMYTDPACFYIGLPKEVV